MTCPVCERSSFKCGCTDEDKYKYAREENEELEDERERIVAAINDYYQAINNREHAGAAASNALDKIQSILGMSWGR